MLGVHNTVNKVFHLVHFECSYSNTTYQLGEDGVIGEFQLCPRSVCMDACNMQSQG